MTKPFSEQQVDNQRQLYLAKEAELVSAGANARQAELAAESQIGGVNTTVAQLRAQLAEAEYNLDRTVLRAPGGGFVTQVALRPGGSSRPGYGPRLMQSRRDKFRPAALSSTRLPARVLATPS